METTSRLISHTEDEDQNDGEWPYPTQYRTYLIEGNLADRVRERSGREGKVTLMEVEESGGYSEYTQETDYYHVLSVDGFAVFSPKVYYPEGTYGSIEAAPNVLVQVTKWLNGE